MPDVHAPGVNLLEHISHRFFLQMTETMNGWANYETWNVALWIQNEFKFYAVALSCGDYREFLSAIADTNVGLTTPDGVPWFSKAINHAEIDAMIEEF